MSEIVEEKPEIVEVSLYSYSQLRVFLVWS